MPRKAKVQLVKDEEEHPYYKPLTERDQQLIDLLLAGKTITEASLIAGFGRQRTVQMMTDPHATVRIEYETQRAQRLLEFENRIANLHNLALAALEDALSPGAPPALRVAVARFLFEKHLAEYADRQQPRDPIALLSAETSLADRQEHWQTYSSYKLKNVIDD